MIANKAILESVSPTFGSSISYRRFNQQMPNGEPKWHYHPELELVYVKTGSGKRHIANHVSYYRRGELLLIGPNVPHYGFTDRMTNRNIEIVVQFKPEMLGLQIDGMIEFQRIKELIERSVYGLSFRGNTRERVGTILESMDIMNPFDRLIHLYQVLNLMAQTSEYEVLNTLNVTVQADQQDKDRMKEVFDYVRAHFEEDISLAFMAELTHLTVPSFCRYFKKNTGRTFSRFVNEFRIIHACKLLSETGRSIADICHECGYNNFSHFNKQFKLITKKSPSEYRVEFKEILM